MGRNLYGIEPIKFNLTSAEIDTDLDIKTWCYQINDCLKKGKIPFFIIGVEDTGQFIGITNFNYVKDEYIQFQIGSDDGADLGTLLTFKIDFISGKYSASLIEH